MNFPKFSGRGCENCSTPPSLPLRGLVSASPFLRISHTIEKRDGISCKNLCIYTNGTVNPFSHLEKLYETFTGTKT